MSKLVSKTHNILYKTTNLHNGHFYIGVHATDKLDDGYLGTGRLIMSARKKYGRKAFTREVIRDFETIEEAYRWESMIVGSDLINDPNCYNISVGGAGCPVSKNKGKKRTPEQIARIKANHRGMTGKKHSEETKRKIGQGNKGKFVSDETRQRISSSKRAAFRERTAMSFDL